MCIHLAPSYSFRKATTPITTTAITTSQVIRLDEPSELTAVGVETGADAAAVARRGVDVPRGISSAAVETAPRIDVVRAEEPPEMPEALAPPI